MRFEVKHNRQVHSALRRFRALDADKALRGQNATSVVWSVLMTAKKRTQGQMDEESLELPGVPEASGVYRAPADLLVRLEWELERLQYGGESGPNTVRD